MKKFLPFVVCRHVGDLGNLEVSVDGTVEKTLTDPLIKLSGDTSVIGKALVVSNLNIFNWQSIGED